MSDINQGNVVYVTRLVQQLTEPNAQTFVTKALMPCLQCQTINEMACAVLRMAFELNKLSDESMTQLKQQAFTIANQQIENDTEAKNTQYSLYQYVKTKNIKELNKSLNTISSNVIGHIGSFLNHTDIIALGATSTQLCIDTYNLHFVKKQTCFSDLTLYNLPDIRYPWHRLFPSILTLRDINWHDGIDAISTASSIRQGIFSNVNELYCSHAGWLPYIAWPSIFHTTKQLQCDSNILDILCIDVTDCDSEEYVKQFTEIWHVDNMPNS